jgi:hypothetical protein
MSGTVIDRFETWAAGWIHWLLVTEEEHRPLPDKPGAAMLVLRVSERLSLAATAVADYELVLEDEDEDEDEKTVAETLLPIAIYFLGAASFALTAIAHVSDHLPDATTTERKDAFLDALDQDVAGTLETDDYLQEFTPAELLYHVTSYTTKASQCAIELEGVNAIFGEGEEDDYGDEDDEDDEEPPTIDELLLEVEESEPLADEELEGYLRAGLADSLWETAVMAAAAGQVLVEHYEERIGRGS